MDIQTVHIRLFRSFEVEVGGRRVAAEAWRTRRRATELVQLLALAAGHRVPREQAMTALWPESDEGSAGRNLRKAAHHARQLVGIDEFVVLDGATVGLWPQAQITSDVGAFEEAARTALAVRDEDERSERARDAVSLYRSGLLPEEPSVAWRDGHTRALEALYRDVLVAARHWGRLLVRDSTDEVAHRGTIRDRLDAGDRAGAIRQFDVMRQALNEELGVGPSPESVALYEMVLASEGRDVPTPAERARALLAWGMVHWERADLDEAARAAREARALAIDAGLGRELADASELRGLVAYAQGRWRQVFADDLIESIEARSELTPFIYDANLCMSEFAIHEPDGLGALLSFGDALLETAGRSGALVARAVGLLLRGEANLLAGDDPDAVRADLRQSLALHRAAGATSGRALALERLAQVEARVGNAAAAHQLREEAMELAQVSAVTNHLLPLIFGGMLADVPVDDGARTLERAKDELADVDVCKPCSMSFHLGAAGVQAECGVLEEAHGHLEAARGISAMWQGGPWHAAVAEATARVRQAEGAPADEMRELLRTAAATFEDSGRRHDAGRCRATLRSLG